MYFSSSYNKSYYTFGLSNKNPIGWDTDRQYKIALHSFPLTTPADIFSSVINLFPDLGKIHFVFFVLSFLISKVIQFLPKFGMKMMIAQHKTKM